MGRSQKNVILIFLEIQCSTVLLSYFMMDFDLVFGKLHEMMGRDKLYQKEFISVDIKRDTLQKQRKKKQNIKK